MIIENLSIKRVVIHEISPQKDGPRIAVPFYGKSIEVLNERAHTYFRVRITEAMSARSKSIEMKIVRDDNESLLGVVKEIISENDDNFISISRRAADSLVEAQKSRGIPGGMLLVFDGTVGSDDKPFVGVLKAEMQSGFQRRSEIETMTTEFLENIFLTPATRLYKLALFISKDQIVSNITEWRCFVFDSNITSNRRENAAVYFYDAFLGCAFPEDGRYETMRFFDLTKIFIRTKVADSNLRRDLGDALFSFIKTNQSSTFTSEEFGKNYLPVELRDSFDNFLEQKKFPTNRAIVRDTTSMGNRLKRRKYKFGSDIEFSVSPDALQNGVATIKNVPSAKNPDDKWTQITIREQMTEEI